MLRRVGSMSWWKTEWYGWLADEWPYMLAAVVALYLLETCK